jgi:hypothetical protein
VWLNLSSRVKQGQAPSDARAVRSNPDSSSVSASASPATASKKAVALATGAAAAPATAPAPASKGSSSSQPRRVKQPQQQAQQLSPPPQHLPNFDAATTDAPAPDTTARNEQAYHNLPTVERPVDFSIDQFLVDLYRFAESNSPTRGAPLYWYDTASKLWLPGVGAQSVGALPFDRFKPVFYSQYPYPVHYSGVGVPDFAGFYSRRLSGGSGGSGGGGGGGGLARKGSGGGGGGNGRRQAVPAATEREQFGVHIENGKFVQPDARTSLMIRNIPNKYTQAMLLAEIEPFKGQFDLFYLPIDFHNMCNVGYAFINFVDVKFIPAFYEHFHGLRWSQFNSHKVCDITYARIQGQRNMLKHFQFSRVMVDEPTYQPVVYAGATSAATTTATAAAAAAAAAPAAAAESDSASNK